MAFASESDCFARRIEYHSYNTHMVAYRYGLLAFFVDCMAFILEAIWPPHVNCTALVSSRSCMAHMQGHSGCLIGFYGIKWLSYRDPMLCISDSCGFRIGTIWFISWSPLVFIWGPMVGGGPMVVIQESRGFPIWTQRFSYWFLKAFAEQSIAFSPYESDGLIFRFV